MDTITKHNEEKLIYLKVYQQETQFSCGAAIVKTLLDYYGRLKSMSEAEICIKLGTRFEDPHLGTHPDKMVSFLKSEGLIVESGENAGMKLLYHYIDQNIPVIVLDSTWGGHWRMVVGYGRQIDQVQAGNRDIYIADPEFETSSQKFSDYNGVVIENENQFCAKWFEDSLYERARDRYYIVAYPADGNIVQYSVAVGTIL